MRRIITFDLGDTTGWARSTASGSMQSGILPLKIRLEEHPGARWRRARDTIRESMRGHDFVAWELIVNAGGNFSKSTLFGLECQLVECAWELKIEPVTVAPGTLKKFATCHDPHGCDHSPKNKSCTGNGQASKDEMRTAGRKRWAGVTFSTHDEIDARWILEWATRATKTTTPRPRGFATPRPKRTA